MDILSFSLPHFYLLAFAFGIVGQSMRGLLGLVKRFREFGGFAFKGTFFALTLVLGGVAGLLGALVYDLRGVSPTTISLDQILADRNFILMAISAGYFGTDVIEGVLGRYTPSRPQNTADSGFF